jgi:DNA-binding MarR family transcriptional regulator
VDIAPVPVRSTHVPGLECAHAIVPHLFCPRFIVALISDELPNFTAMRLEEAIQQKHFPNEIEKAFVNVIFTANQFYANHLQRLKPHGISPEQFNVLRILRGSHPKTLSLMDIAGRMLDKNSNATRLVEKLRLKELVTRNICPADRRQVDIGITGRGLSLLDLLDVEMKEWFNQFNHITEEEARQLNGLLDKIRGPH